MVNSYKDLKIGFIGAGKVGFSLGKLFCEKGIHVTGYYSRQVESAEEAASFTGSRCFNDLESLVNASSALFLTVPDGEIFSVFQSIKDLNISKKIICHTSGALSSKEAFIGIGDVGAFGYSVHPLFPVSSKTDSFKELEDAFFCVEGDAACIKVVYDLLACNGLRSKIISADNKVKYHAACAISSNLICGLINESLQLMQQCGFGEAEALDAMEPLINSNIRHITEDGLVNALTGPIERNDFSTVEKHISCFDSDEERSLYRSVSLQVVDIAKRKHKDRDYSKTEDILLGGINGEKHSIIPIGKEE